MTLTLGRRALSVARPREPLDTLCDGCSSDCKPTSQYVYLISDLVSTVETGRETYGLAGPVMAQYVGYHALSGWVPRPLQTQRWPAIVRRTCTSNSPLLHHCVGSTPGALAGPELRPCGAGLPSPSHPSLRKRWPHRPSWRAGDRRARGGWAFPSSAVTRPKL
jgi:hypothetical protein